MKDKLEIGTFVSGNKFTLPLDLVTRTLAIIAIRGWGKTVAATVIAEEMCESGLPWVAIDPVGVWWGLRANPDGSPGGYPVVILGGEHGDLPLEKSAGAKVAEAVLQDNISCVIDMSSESKTTVRHFVAAFCDRLMDLRPEAPRHIFIEEAPELVPQKPMGEQKRSLAAVDRLIRLGRNRGYGATLISQRTATIQKDVLTQCESLLAGRSIGKPDRDAMRDWIAEVVGVPAPTDADKFVGSLSRLASGTGWFWSPQWLDVFEQIKIRRRNTYHPGETRTVGVALKRVRLLNVDEFVERFGELLNPPKNVAAPQKVEDDEVFKEKYEQEKSRADRLEAKVADLQQRLDRLLAKQQQEWPSKNTAPKARLEPSELPANGNSASLSEIWAFVREQITRDPALMNLTKSVPQLDVTARRYTVTADDSTLLGRMAILLSEGFFDSPKGNQDVVTELGRRGKQTMAPRVSEAFAKLAEMGFLTKESDGYLAVKGMKVRVREVEAA